MTVLLFQHCGCFINVRVINLAIYLIFFSDPTILPSVQVDQGAIRSIMNGADVMAPGLTSADSRLPMDLKPDTIVVN